MIIRKQEEFFRPVTIVIENLDELLWLAAISNASITYACNSAESQGFELNKEKRDDIQMQFYEQIKEIREEYTDVE